MAIRGSCLCGSVTFEIDRACGPAEYCHCNRCRKRSGSASLLTIRVNTKDYRLLAGREFVRTYAAPILHSPPAYESFFCSNCGSPVPAPAPEGESFEIPAGLFDDDFGIRPDKHIFVDFMPPWDRINDELPAYTKQEIYEQRAAPRAAATDVKRAAEPNEPEPRCTGVVPILFVHDVAAAAAFYNEKLGFQVDFLHGNPAFYGAVSRDGACLHLRFVHEPNFPALAAREDSLILATIEVTNVKTLFEEYERRGMAFAQRLTRQPWGGVDFQIRDVDGNVISFVQYVHSEGQSE